MNIKHFTAKTEAEALQMAKKELGENVVVLTVKKVKPKGLFSFLKSNTVDLTAAIEESTDVMHNTSAGNDIAEALASVDRLRIKAEQNGDMPVTKPIENKAATKETGSEKSSSQAIEMLDNIQNLLEQKLKKNEDITEKAASDEKKEEPKETQKHEEPNSEIMDFVKLLYHTMIDNEVSEKYANQVIDEIEKNASEDVDVEYILSQVYQKMILKFGKSSCIVPSTNKKAKVVFFIGPTGVGKTTTLAKIVSSMCINENKKVALLTADTYRIAATDQLKTYAGILNVPFHIIYTKEDLCDCYNTYCNYDYILVDTSGHSHRNDEQGKAIEELIKAMNDKAEQEVYLVLSATTKYRDLVEIADKYKEMTNYKLIFTKLDETSTLGNLLNIKLHTDAPMSYITCGQNVPDDIECFNPQYTVRKILGGQS